MKYGFIYLWLNTTNGMKYIGSHYGTIDDGYISSSSSFNIEYDKNPSIFYRIIIESNLSREDALRRERKILFDVDAMHKADYYNLHNAAGCGWKHHDSYDLAKIYYNKISESKKGKPPPNKGKPMSKKQKDNLSDEWLIKEINTGKEYKIKNMSEFCVLYDLNPSAMSAVARGKSRQHKGYFCKKITNNRNVKYSYKEWKGKPRSKNSILFGEKNGFSKKVTVNNVKYACMREACEKLNISMYKLRKIIKNG